MLAGALGVFASNALFFWGLHSAPSIDSSMIVPVFSPVLTTAVSALVLGDAAAPDRLVGLAVGVAEALLATLAAPKLPSVAWSGLPVRLWLDIPTSR